MKTTIDIADDLYRDVKAEAARRGLTVREVTTSLYAAWLAGAVPAARAGGDRPDVQRWLADLDALAQRADAADRLRGVGAAEQVRADRDARG